MSKGLHGSALPALLHLIHFCLLDWLHPAALLGRYLRALAPLTSWGIIHNPGSIFTVSCSSLSGTPHKDCPARYLAAAVLCKHGGRLHNPFVHAFFMKARTSWMILPSLANSGWTWHPQSPALGCTSSHKVTASQTVLLTGDKVWAYGAMLIKPLH